MYIEKVTFLSDYIIQIMLNGNYNFYYDLKPMMKYKEYRELRDQDLFESGRLEDGCRIVWDNDVRLEDYELLGYEIFESSLYMLSENKYNMCCLEYCNGVA